MHEKKKGLLIAVIIITIILWVGVGFIVLFRVQDQITKLYTFNKAYDILISDGYELIDIRTTSIKLYTPDSKYTQIEIEEFTACMQL